MEKQKLFMIMLGCKPQGRHTEQHDIFFGIAPTLKELIPSILEFWPETKDKIHIDAWREVNHVGKYKIEVVAASEQIQNETKLFFINLGGYRAGEFDEPHYKMLLATKDKSEAIKRAKETAFYKHTGFEGACSHIDDKYGIDIDDFFEINDALDKKLKEKYKIKLSPASTSFEDQIHLGYLPLKKIK